MNRSTRPAVDPRVVSAFGVSREGQPLSYNRAPAPDLAPWIARLSVTKLDIPADYAFSCSLFADAAGVRFQISGALEANTRDGLQGFAPGALFCGPHTRSMPVRVAGGFTSIGISFRPSACTALLGPRVPEYVDRIAPIKDSSAQLLLSSIDQSASAEQWLKALETVLRRVLDLRGPQPEPVTARFEEIAFRNPSMSIAQAARDIGVDRRRLERLVLRDFGLPPKQVLRRARALDMASYLRGVADDAEAAALSLRYYDESHLIHEFTELFGMSPRQFMALPQPLLTLNLEIRQARRLEMIGRIAPGAKRPWE